MISIRDQAIILRVRKHAETSAHVTMLTQSHGVYHGIARGAFSNRQRGLYQPGNRVEMHWNARISDHLGAVTCEMIEANAALVMQEPQALSLLSSICTLLTQALPERHAYPSLYEGLLHLISQLTQSPKSALRDYVEFEMLLLAETGFGLDLSCCVATGSTDNLCYVSPKSGRAVCAEAGEPYKNKLLKLPAFLIDASLSANEVDISHGLELTHYFIEHWLFESLHRPVPAARIRLQAA